MDEFLTADIDRADGLIDLSNVVRDRRLGGSGIADLTRARRVATALGVLCGQSEVALYAVADESLLAGSLFPDDFQYRELRDFVTAGVIHMAPKADPVLLELAEGTGLPIITRDRFVGHRREFSWLDGSDDAVLEPTTDDRGDVVLTHVTLAVLPEWRKSVGEEQDLIIQQGLRPRLDLLTRIWACPEPRCRWHDPATAGWFLVPRWRGGRLFCDIHGRDVVDLGPRPKFAQVKVMVNGKERCRFAVRENEPVTVGRGRCDLSLEPWLDPSTSLQVSREHLRFELCADRLQVTDRSRNGTRMICRDGSSVHLHASSAPFTVGDELEPVAGLRIARSGRRFPAELNDVRSIGPVYDGTETPPTPTISA
ncbi:hypothetical protein [Nocardia niigatensis]